MVHHFKKELVSMPFHVNGSPVQFEVLNGNRGVLALDDANPAAKSIILALDEAAKDQRGGIVKLSEAEYLDVKKNQVYLTPLNALKRKSPFAEPLRVFKQPNDPFGKKAAAPAGIKSGFIQVPPTAAAAKPNPKMQHIAEKAAERAAQKIFKPATARVANKVAPPTPPPPDTK